MFTTLRFRMENAIGTPVTVNLFNCDGLIEYEILIPELGVRDVQRTSMGISASEDLMKKLQKSCFVYFMAEFAQRGEQENEGDFWHLWLELPDGREYELSGPRPEESVLYPFIQDFSELLDGQFSMTQFVRPDRVDRLEVDFVFNEIDREFCEHVENVTLDRSTFLFRYSKRFPASCMHSSYECKCEMQVRQILDQTSTALADERHLEDMFEEDRDCPLLVFSFFFHDGSTLCVRRSLSLLCLLDGLYSELMNVLFETSLHLIYKGGMFDKRFLFPMALGKNNPFYVVYSEELDDLTEDETTPA